MLPIIRECCRVSRGLVLINCAGVTRDWNYQPAAEGLLYEWWKSGGMSWRPCYWNRVGIPGSGGEQWLRADVEYVLAFMGTRGKIPWSDNTANGHAPKWAPGGEMSYRVSDGSRVNQWGHPIDTGGTGGSIDDPTCGPARPSHHPLMRSNTTRRAPDGSRDNFGFAGTRGRGRYANGEPKPDRPINEDNRNHNGNNRKQRGNPSGQTLTVPAIANPGNLVKIIVGGGVMGHPSAHDNEAPFPVDLPAWFIRSHCIPGGIVCDPFMGSSSTGQAAIELGRKYIGMDLRWSQCELSRRRLNGAQHPLFS